MLYSVSGVLNNSSSIFLTALSFIPVKSTSPPPVPVSVGGLTSSTGFTKQYYLSEPEFQDSAEGVRFASGNSGKA